MKSTILTYLTNPERNFGVTCFTLGILVGITVSMARDHLMWFGLIIFLIALIEGITAYRRHAARVAARRKAWQEKLEAQRWREEQQASLDKAYENGLIDDEFRQREEEAIWYG